MAKSFKPLKEDKGGAATLPLPAHMLPNDPPAGGPQPIGHRVTLQAKTPLAQNPFESDKTTPGEAWKEFCEANGISGSDCPTKIEPLY